MSDNYISKHETRNYYLRISTDNTQYELVNKNTQIVELATPMLPQAILNMHNFEGALSDLSDYSYDEEIPDNVLPFITE